MKTAFKAAQFQLRRGGQRYRITLRRVSAEAIRYNNGGDSALGDYDTEWNDSHRVMPLHNAALLRAELIQDGFQEEKFWKSNSGNH